jgi:hypothetical protein
MGSAGKVVAGISTGGLSTVLGGGLGDIEGTGQKIGGFLGINPETKLEGMGQFRLSGEALQGEAESLRRFREIASGKTPSISEMQFQKAMQDLSKQQLGAAASARGMSNVGLAQREAMQAGKEAGIDLGAQSAIAKEQEIRGASEQILRQAAAQRGVALGAAQANLEAGLAGSRMRSEFISNLASSGAKAMSGGGAAGPNSDVSLKENMNQSEKSGSEMVEEFLNALKSYTYNYKDKENNGQKNPEGKVTSVMAQDLEKSKLGKQMVTEGPEGKMVDYGQGMAPLFAAIAELNQRTKKLEKKG